MNTFAKFAYTTAAASALVMAITASAQADDNFADIKAPAPYSAYVQDSSGNIVRTPYGLCVHTGYWTEADRTVVGCDGVVAKKVEAAVVVPPAPAPKPTPTSEKVTFSADALFDFDKSVLKPEGKRKLTALVEKLRDVNLEAIVATGHTDSIGTVAYNQKLSVRRAESVKHFLVSHGIPADRIYVSGKGESQPVATNKTAAGRALNRRVDVEVVGTRSTTHHTEETQEMHQPHHGHKKHHEHKEHHNKEHHKHHKHHKHHEQKHLEQDQK